MVTSSLPHRVWVALLLPLSAVPLSPLPQCREGEHYCSASDACWFMNVSQPEKFFNGRNDAWLERYFDSGYSRQRELLNDPYLNRGVVASRIRKNVCSVVCGHGLQATNFSCGALGCLRIADCPTASTAVIDRLAVMHSERDSDLYRAHATDEHIDEDMGDHRMTRHTLALNRSFVRMSVHGKPVPEGMSQQYFDRMILIRRSMQLQFYITMEPTVHPDQWREPIFDLPKAEIHSMDILVGWGCLDDYHNALGRLGCARVMPLGCNATIPNRFYEAGIRIRYTNVAEACEVSCGTCTLGTVPQYSPQNICEVSKDMLHCLESINAKPVCEPFDVETLYGTSCYDVQFCPQVQDLVHSRNKTCHAHCSSPISGVVCTSEGLYAPRQERGGYAFCVDTVSGEELNGTRVPVSERSALLCEVEISNKTSCQGSCGSLSQDIARPRILSLGKVVFKFSAGKAKSRALRGVLEQEIKHTTFKIEADTPGKVVLSVYPSVDKLMRLRGPKGVLLSRPPSMGVLSLAASIELEQKTLAFLQATLDTPLTWEAANEVMLYEPQMQWEPITTKTAVAEIPGKFRVTITQVAVAYTVMHVEFLDGFEKEQPPGGYYWGVYHPRVDGKCPIPDDAVFDPLEVKLHEKCITGDSSLRPLYCRSGDMTRKYGKLREQEVSFRDSHVRLSGWGSVLGKVVVLRGNGVHCALIVPQAEAGEGVALVADFSHETAQTSGVELSGSVNIWQRGPWEDTLIGVSLRAGEELRDVSFHISSKRLEEYPEGCAAGYTPDTDLYDPFAVMGGGVERSTLEECLTDKGAPNTVGTPHIPHDGVPNPFSDDQYVYRCPLGDLTPHMQSARHIVTNASNPANSNDAPVVYNYTAIHYHLNVVDSPGALRPSDASFRGGHTLVLLHEKRVVACARLTGKGGEAYVGLQQTTSEVTVHLIWGTLVGVACVAACVVLCVLRVKHRGSSAAKGLTP